MWASLQPRSVVGTRTASRAFVFWVFVFEAPAPTQGAVWLGFIVVVSFAFPFALKTLLCHERGDCPGHLAPLFIHRTDPARAAAEPATPSHPVPLGPTSDLEGPALGVRGILACSVPCRPKRASWGGGPQSPWSQATAEAPEGEGCRPWLGTLAPGCPPCVCSKQQHLTLPSLDPQVLCCAKESSSFRSPKKVQE